LDPDKSNQPGDKSQLDQQNNPGEPSRSGEPPVLPGAPLREEEEDQDEQEDVLNASGEVLLALGRALYC
jgi:hypothetical protein